MEKDPWDWSVDEVVRNLFGERGLLRQFNLADGAASNIANLIRESETDGCELLLSTYDPSNPQIGLHQLQIRSQWRKLEIVIENLRFRSDKYIQYLREKEQHAARFEPFSAIRDSLGHQRAVQRSPKISSASVANFKAEQLASRDASVRPGAVQEADFLKSRAHQPTTFPPNALQHLSLNEVGNASSEPEQSSVSPHHSALGLKRFRSSGSGVGNVEEESSANGPSDGRGAEKPCGDLAQSEVRLRENEFFVTDEHGRKRRKLQLVAQDIPTALPFTSRPDEDSGFSSGGEKDWDSTVGPSGVVHDGALPQCDEFKETSTNQGTTKTDLSWLMQEHDKPINSIEPETTAIEPPPMLLEFASEVDRKSGVVSSTFRPEQDEHVTFCTALEKQTVHEEPLHCNPIEPVQDEDLFEPNQDDDLLENIQEQEMNHQEPNENNETVDQTREHRGSVKPERKKRRLQPQLIGPVVTKSQESTVHVQPPTSETIEADSSTSSPGAEESVVKSEAQIQKQVAPRPRCEYLGRSTLPVDQIFYGSTKVGEPITFETSESTSQLIPLDQDMDSFHFVSSDTCPTGQRLVVAQLMQGFLYGNNVRTLIYGQKHLTTVIPYNARISKRSQQPSMTLLTRLGDSIVARRVNRARWLRYDPANRVSASSSDENSQTLEFDVEQEESPLLSVGRNEVHDYDFLEKWQHGAEDRILPAYGDSGSEGEYDLDTWNQMQIEKGELEQDPAPPSKNRLLDAKRADEIVEEVENRFKERWRFQKLPKLANKAWSLWKRSRRQHTFRDQLQSLALEIQRLDQQYLKIKKEILKEHWTSEGKLKAQCKSFEVSVCDRETCHWKTGVLELRFAPPKPPPSQSLPRKVPTCCSQEPLQDGDEDIESSSLESLDDDLDDFITGDESADQDSASDTVDSENNFVSHDHSNNDDVPNTTRLETGSRPAAYAGDTSSPKDRGESIASHRSIVFRKKILPPAEETTDAGQLGGIAGSPLPKTENTLTNKAKTPAKKADRSELIPLMLTSSPIPHLTKPDVIDLTNLSDSDEQVPQPDERGKRIATPPVFVKAEADNPFSRRANAKCGFRMPPDSSSIYDHDSEMENPTNGKRSPEVRLEKLPAHKEVDQIAKLDPEYLKQIHDEDRLLIWLIHRAGLSPRRRVIQLLKSQKSEIMQVHVWQGLRAIEHGSDQPEDLCWDEMPSDQAKAYMRLAAWFICWSQCSIAFPEGSSQDSPAFPKKDVVEAINDGIKFEAFFNILKRFLQYFADKKKSQSRLLGSSPSTSKKKRIRRVASGSEDSEDQRTNKRKKRVYEVPESQQALELQRAGKLRIEQQEKRQKEMDQRMKQLGAASNDISTKIINTSANQDQAMIAISPHIASKIQSHQLDGVRFLWREIVHAEEGGCLLAHTMGLGKTMQV